jgi:hypothetical protein
MQYDDLGRLKQVDKKVANSLVNGGSIPPVWTTTVQNEYDATGQLIKKKLGNKPGTQNTALANLQYNYNIHGWLTAINKNFIQNNNNDEYFAMELGYDKNGSFSSFIPAYNGNISGTIWKSDGDQTVRKYDFTYDAVNRLTGANFSQPLASNAAIDFSVSNLTYDANGNITTMQQKGLKLNSSPLIDDLSYVYDKNNISNKLILVTDGQNDNTSKLGDFKYDPNTKTAVDYGYDDNGNLTSDRNKKIAGITYNHLNLPIIVATDKGYITYEYDAASTKLSKTVLETSTSVALNSTTYTTSITTSTSYFRRVSLRI